ncbi:DUF6622 family protein [Pseudorhodoferax sp. Leaf274]|uniref:DUF6622 family protein n=1 Tax=Pseudorhodoferax sp. Leaf274 TaxID=1736318 RepID=UPI00070260CD|nr:DUF6622 family protein [Pseudorhodoferax sp. Leaf274]KQP43074.1 hypothetical protein ASF44_05750 [Pseudorhodoferax sp. Leaf274]
MLIQILTHTPAWVFALFALLAWLGAKQLQDGSTHLARVAAMPVAMVALAVYGVAGAFGRSDAGWLALAGWGLAAAAALAAVARLPLNPAVRYDPVSRRFFQPGSWVPLALMMGIFATKYAVGVLLAMHPGLAHQGGFATGISTLYGLFSGMFAGRALRLCRLALQHRTAGATA